MANYAEERDRGDRLNQHDAEENQVPQREQTL